jgi:hypothetical protein
MATRLISRHRTPTPFALAAVLLCNALAGAQQQTTTKPPQTPQTMPAGRDTTQPAATGTGVIAGTVVNANGGRPVRRAVVRIAGTAPVTSMSATTDDQGNFTFSNLPAGQFTLTATKPGYLDAVYGQKRTGNGRPGTPLTLADAQQLTKLSLPIARGGVITGTVIDDVGEPMFGTRVQALRFGMKGGERTLMPQATTTTDDRGIYRMPALPPGDYVVMATPPDNSGSDADKVAADAAMSMRAGGGVALTAGTLSAGYAANGAGPGGSDDNASSTGYAPVYYPGTTLPGGAQSLAIDIGEEKTAIDLQLQLVPMGKITGVVVGDPRVLPSVTVQLIDANQTLPGLGQRSARPGPDGKFSFANVPPGQYTIFAKSGGMTVSIDTSGGQMKMMVMRSVTSSGGNDPNGPGAPPPPMWAMSDATVDGRQPVNVMLTLQSGMTITGKIAFDGSSPVPQNLTQVRVLLSPASVLDPKASSAMGSVDADGKFKIADVPPGSYHLITTPPGGGWRPKSIDVAGRDMLDFPLEVKPSEDVAGAVITFTDRATDISGTLQDQNGQPTSDYTVVLFSQDQRYWTPQSRRIAATRPATDGKFMFGNLPAGDYRMIALADVEPGQWYDPALLRQLLNGSIAISVNDGDHKVQDIRVAK